MGHLSEGPLRNEPVDPNFWNLLYQATSANGKITHNDVKLEQKSWSNCAVLNSNQAKTNEDLGFLQNKEAQMCTPPRDSLCSKQAKPTELFLVTTLVECKNMEVEKEII